MTHRHLIPAFGLVISLIIGCDGNKNDKAAGDPMGTDQVAEGNAAETVAAENDFETVEVDRPAGSSELSASELPDPDLSHMDPSVRLQLSNAREVALQHLGSGLRGSELGAKIGSLAMLYHAYDLLPAAQQSYDLARRLDPLSAEWSYYAGSVAQRLGRLPEAIELFELAWKRIDAAPASEQTDHIHTATAWRLGRVLRQANQGDKARSWLERAASDDRRCPAAYFELGQLALTEDRPSEAVEHFERTLHIQSDALQVLFPLGQALKRAGREKEAQVYLQRSAEREKSIGGRARCIDPLDARLGELTTGAAAFITRGQHARFAGDIDTAIAEFRRAVELAPQDPIAHQALGRGWAEKGDLPTAIRFYRRAAELDPSSPTLANDLAILLLQTGQAAEAVTTLRRVLAAHPDFSPSWLALANAQQSQGLLAEALASLDRVLALEPDHPQARGKRAQILVSLGRRNEAAAEMARLLDENPPTDPAERLRIAGALVQLGDSQRAAIHLSALVEDDSVSDPLKARALMSLAGLDLQRGDLDSAKGRLRLAMELDPEFQPAQEALRRLPPNTQ